MFSRRASWDLRANRLAALLAEKRSRGDQVLDLSLSNPTRAELVYPPEAARALAVSGDGNYRAEPLGLPEARQAVASYYAGRGLRAEAENILLTASTSEAYAFLFKLLADPGDEVLVPRPSYPLFEFLAGLEGVERRFYPLRRGAGGWEVDLDRLSAALSPRTRAVVLVHPNNPTGSFVRRRERLALEELARECGLALIVDEVFGDYAWRADPERVDSFVGACTVPTFALSGLSKVLGMPQLKLSWMVVQGPDSHRREALDRLEVIADTYLSVGTRVQRALPRLFETRSSVQGQILARVRRNRAFLATALASGEPARLLEGDGGWCAVVETERRDEEALVVELLRQRGLLLQPGYFFDFDREGILVLSLLVQESDFRSGVESLIAHLRG